MKKEDNKKSEALKEDIQLNAERTTLMTAFSELSIRDIVLRANEEKVKRENIVSLLKESGQYILVYYK